MYENFKKFTMLEDQPTTASDSTGNTDGEGTQKVSLGELLLNAGTRIVDLEKQSNDQVEIITHLDQELASLREQLAKKEELITSIRHKLYDRDTDDAIIHEIGQLLTEGGYPYETED